MKKRDNNWYVTASDTFWGVKSKMVCVCPDLPTARKWRDKWEGFSNLRRVNIRCTKPYYGGDTQVSFYDGANGGERIESLRGEIVTSKMESDFKRLGL